MAWATPLGDSLAGVWERLLACETGLVEVPHGPRLRNSLGAPCAWPPADASPEQRMHDLGVSTVKRALLNAGAEEVDELVIGTSLGAFLEGDAPLHRYADAIGEAVGRPNPISLSTACSSGSDAILLGAELLRAGVTKRVVCGGVDVLTITKRLAHSALGSMSPTTLRAFDRRHDGTLLGEGAGFLVLEVDADDRAKAFLRGAGGANDAAGMTTPDAEGLGARRAIERSLADGDVAAHTVGVINAHASGTPLNDATEALAFNAVFDPSAIVFGTKGNFGHSLGATGAIEAIATILALREGKVPPVYGLEDPDPALKLLVPRGAPLPTNARFGVSVTLGFGGFDTSLVFEKSS
jgi:3-oxoacyl-[acyl-carrier-protein] synthase II